MDEEPTEDMLLAAMVWQYKDELTACRRGGRALSSGHAATFLNEQLINGIKDWESLTGKQWPPADDSDPLGFPADPARIDLTYTLSSELCDKDLELDQWHVSADIEGSEIGDVRSCRVGVISLLSIDLDDNPRPFVTLDDLSGDLSALGGTILNVGGRGLKPALQERMDLTGATRILILDLVHLDDRWRGSGWLGALLVGEAIKQLSAISGLVFTYPFPLGAQSDDPEPVDKKALDKVRGVYRKLGFRHYREGVYFLDLTLVDLDEALFKLRKNLR